MRYDAATFLESLFREPANGAADIAPTPPVSMITAADLPADWHLAWDERAAIMEYDGGLPRERAEAAALEEILDRIRRGERFGTTCPCPSCTRGNDACM